MIKKYEIRSSKASEAISSYLHVEYPGNDTIIRYENISINISIVESDTFPFIALKKIRLQLEKYGLLLMCKGNRKDVYPSGGMLSGTYAYQCRLGVRVNFSDTVFIFEQENDPNTLGKVDEQNEYHKNWLESIKGLPY